MDFAEQRREMVERQLKARGIRDARVLAAMLKVPRHRFVPQPFRYEAYADYPLPIGHGQTISQPYIVALMTEALALQGGETVLEVGTGSGYQAAILAELARRVITIERIGALSRLAREALGEYGNITLLTGDGTRGHAPEAPYDAVVVTAAARWVPPALTEQLNHGGRLVIPVGDQFLQELLKITRTPSGLHETRLTGVRFVPLIGGEEPGASGSFPDRDTDPQ